MRIYGGSLTFRGHSDGPIEEVEVSVAEKLFDHLPVARVVGKVLVELRSYGSDLAQVVPRGIGEIVMLQVIPQVQVEEVPKTDIVVGLLALDELIMLRDDVDGGGMRTD